MNAKFWFEGHLTEECLIGLLDGELDRLAVRSAEKHLKTCWTCQRRSEMARQSMSRFIEFHERLSAAPAAQPARGWRDFDSRLEQTAARLSLHKGSSWRGRVARAMLAPAAAAVTLALVVWLTEPRQLSASEVYARSAEVERQSLARAGGAVIVREFRVESGERTGHLAVWHAPALRKTQSFWDASSDAKLKNDVQSIYSKAGLQMGDLLSAENHSRWDRSLPNRMDSVEQDQSLLRVITRNVEQPRDGEIVRAELVLRSEDWHPIEERFEVGGREGGEYRVVETGYRVETARAELARMYAILTGDNPHDASPAMVASVSGAEALLPVAPMEPERSAQDAEVEALAVLHELGADRQEAATVQRDGSQVTVTVYVSTDDRRALIERRLSSISGLRLVFHSLTGQMDVTPALAAAAEVSVAAPPAPRVVTPRTPPFAKALSEQAGSTAAANDLVSQRLDLLANLGVELRATERLAARFPEQARAGLSVAARRRLDDLAADHLESARRTWSELNMSSAPFRMAMGLSEGDAASDPENCGDWFRDRHLAAAASRLEDLFGRAFTTMAGGVDGDAGASKDSIRSGIEQVSAELSRALVPGCLK